MRTMTFDKLLIYWTDMNYEVAHTVDDHNNELSVTISTPGRSHRVVTNLIPVRLGDGYIYTPDYDTTHLQLKKWHDRVMSEPIPAEC